MAIPKVSYTTISTISLVPAPVVSVVLTTGAGTNDIVEMVVYDTFGIANSYTKTEADTRYPFKGNNSIIRLNGQTINADITIDSDENGVSAGPITQSATVTVNGYWSIV